jgi:hypothetical protein
MSGGRSPKRKGVRVERELVQRLLENGLVCARVPLSGTAGGVWGGDIHLELLGRVHRVEVKSRARFVTLYRWLKTADFLLLKADRLDPIAVLPLSLLAELAAATSAVVIDTPAIPDVAPSINFDAVPGQLFCKCGAELDVFCLQRRPNGSALVTCGNCHSELGQITAELEPRS